MLQDPNVERYVQERIEPLQEQIKELQATIFKLMQANNLHLQNVMPRFTYRLYERGQVRTYEIGELDNPRTSPREWCDRRLCEGFWGDEESCKKVVALLNGA